MSIGINSSGTRNSEIEKMLFHKHPSPDLHIYCSLLVDGFCLMRRRRENGKIVAHAICYTERHYWLFFWAHFKWSLEMRLHKHLWKFAHQGCKCAAWSSALIERGRLFSAVKMIRQIWKYHVWRASWACDIFQEAIGALRWLVYWSENGASALFIYFGWFWKMCAAGVH
jgi:hypothetical protein